MQVCKGTLQSVNGSTAIVVPTEHPDIVTQPLVIPYYWRELMGFIKPGELVYYIEDDEHSGMIIARADGNWDQIIRGTLTVEQAVTLNDTLSIQGNTSSQANITASGTIQAGSVVLNTHTHTSSTPGTPTSPPN